MLLGLVMGPVAADAARIDMLIDDHWTFMRANPPGAEKVGFDDSHWNQVSVPHTWNAFDGEDGGNDYYRGTAWYRKTFRLDDSLKSRSIMVRFEAVSLVATVYVNGSEVGTHRGGFAAFCFDVTPYVKFGEANLIAVKVSNARDRDVTPLSGDFTVFGGIYRHVHLLILPRLSISPLDFGSSGVYLTQRDASTSVAHIDAAAIVRNADDQSRTATVEWKVVDDHGKTVTQQSSTSIIGGKSSGTVRGRLTIENPHLWQGRKDPYLYTVITEVRESGRSYDRVDQPLGIRFYRVDPEKGFFLNGNAYPLHGVNRHQDRMNMGWAITENEQREDFALIKELGCTVVRLAHYQHAQTFYDLCDKGGMVVWAELALVDHITESPAFTENCKQQIKELILQNYNHPSICFWSMENELIPDPNPAAYGSLVKQLHEEAKTLDSTRLTTVASRGNYDGATSINTSTDVIGYNVYKGWYEGKAEDFAAYVDGMHRRFPDKPMAISEYGAGAGITQHEYPPHQPEPGGPWHPEEWQAFVHETIWKAMETRQFLWGTFVWNMFDFASDGRSEGEYLGRNDKGLVTYDRKIKKDAFYWYKSNWNPEPMVHITSKRYNPRPAGPTAVKVYSNCPSVELRVDGIVLGQKKVDEHIVMWEGIPFEEGKHAVQVRGIGRGDGVVVSCEWAFERGPP